MIKGDSDTEAAGYLEECSNERIDELAEPVVMIMLDKSRFTALS